MGNTVRHYGFAALCFLVAATLPSIITPADPGVEIMVTAATQR